MSRIKRALDRIQFGPALAELEARLSYPQGEMAQLALEQSLDVEAEELTFFDYADFLFEDLYEAHPAKRRRDY